MLLAVYDIGIGLSCKQIFYMHKAGRHETNIRIEIYTYKYGHFYGIHSMATDITIEYGTSAYKSTLSLSLHWTLDKRDMHTNFA